MTDRKEEGLFYLGCCLAAGISELGNIFGLEICTIPLAILILASTAFILKKRLEKLKD